MNIKLEIIEKIIALEGVKISYYFDNGDFEDYVNSSISIEYRDNIAIHIEYEFAEDEHKYNGKYDIDDRKGSINNSKDIYLYLKGILETDEELEKHILNIINKSLNTLC